jgi:hypothetical protein
MICWMLEDVVFVPKTCVGFMVDVIDVDAESFGNKSQVASVN